MTAGAWLLVAAAALVDCETLDVRGDGQARECYLEVARSAESSAVQAEALWAAGDVTGANAAFRDAVERHPRDASVRARWGRLFLDVHQEADAEVLFREALSLDKDDVQALIGMAELALGRFEPGVRAHLARVLRLHPEHAEAHLILARMHLESGDVPEARKGLTPLLEDGKLEGRHLLEAHALLAAADALEDANPSPWVSRALERNPRFGDIHAVPAHHYVINRRYREAVDRYQAAVAIEPQNWDAHAELGINLLRVNRHQDARRHLTRAYEGDPYNALTVNTLRLLDLLEGFDELRRPGLVVRTPAEHAGALFPEVAKLAARAGREMADRYGYQPDDTVVELYAHHDDFAVRTAGLPGLGILGATFGDVVVMDGPAAKGIDEGFDWASALWHELAHVYTLGATGNRVSRWFSEGVSVMEEWDHGPTPQAGVPLPFLEALAEERLLGVAELDEGFLRPRYPQQVGVSYVQAGLLCQLIARRFPGGLAGMLAGYREGLGTEAVVEGALDVTPEQLDAAFDRYLEERFGPLLEQLEEFRAALRDAHQTAGDGQWAAALEAGGRAIALYPAYVQSDSAYVPVARAAEATGEEALLTQTLEEYYARGGRERWALSTLAERLAAADDRDAELEVRRTLARTLPLDVDIRSTLARRLSAAGLHAQAVEEFRAALSLEPHDLARARLELARSYRALGNIELARRSVLEALEVAPRYAAALDLLLEINRGEP